jgi:sugar phosphate permease
MSLDFGGKDGGATASGVIDSAGYLAGVLSGNGMARVAVEHGWHAFFLLLAVVAVLSSIVAVALLRHQREH